MYLRNMLMRLVLVMFRSVFTLFIDIFVKGGAMISGFLLGIFLYSKISTISQELPTFYLIIIIGLCLLSTYLLSRLIEIVPDCLSIILLFIMSTLAVICIFLSMDFFYNISIELILHTRSVYHLARYSCYMNLDDIGGIGRERPAPSNDKGYNEARAKDRVVSIIFSKICEKYNVHGDVKLMMDKYIENYWLRQHRLDQNQGRFRPISQMFRKKFVCTKDRWTPKRFTGRNNDNW